jgi:zeaxanthin glucosyltransferase
MNSQESMFRCFAQACEGLNVQLVISHGGGLSAAQASSLPGSPIVVAYAPQEELIARARLTITHAGLNTVLDSLAGGVPLVAIPLRYEQPAIAGRVQRVGAGCILSVRGITARRLRSAVGHVLEREEFRESARQMKDAIVEAGGVGQAGTLIESLVAI